MSKYYKHNLYSISVKILDISKQVVNLVNESGNVLRGGVVPKFSDLENVISKMTSEVSKVEYVLIKFCQWIILPIKKIENLH